VNALPSTVAQSAFVALVIAFCLAPGVVVIIGSFTASSHIAFPPIGLSLRWYAELFQRDDFVSAFVLSSWLALITGAASTVLGGAAAYAIVRYRFPGRGLLEALFMAPISMPHVILGLALLQWYAELRISSSLLTLLAAHVLITVPFAIRLMAAGLAGLDQSLERAAYSLGADGLTTLRLVVIPMMRAGLAGAFVLSFLVSFDDVAMTVFLASINVQTLPVKLYNLTEQATTPLVNSASTLLIAIAVAALLVLNRTVGLNKVFGTD
jgi:putative spermidine/putrescine transport system permease protein